MREEKRGRAVAEARRSCFYIFRSGDRSCARGTIIRSNETMRICLVRHFLRDTQQERRKGSQREIPGGTEQIRRRFRAF